MTFGTELSAARSAIESSRPGTYLRLVLCVAAIALIRCLPLASLRWLTSAEILQISTLLGLPIQRAGGTTLLYCGRMQEFTTSCTFIDPLIIVAVLGWRRERPAWRNLGYCGLMIAFLAPLNVVRIEANLFSSGKGFPTWVYHGLFDGFFYFAAIVPGIRVSTRT